MDPLLKYFMEETNERLLRMEQTLSDLTKFKLEMLATARLTAMVVSAVFSIGSVAVSAYISYKFK